MNAHSAILLTGNFAEVPRQRVVANRGETQSFGPLRKGATSGGRTYHLLKVMTGISADRERDAEPGIFGKLLQLVVLVGQQTRRDLQSGNEAIDPCFENGLAHGVEVIARPSANSTH